MIPLLRTNLTKSLIKLITKSTNQENILLAYHDTLHIGLVLECSEENQDCNVKFMSRKDLNLRWILDSQISLCWVPC